ncbi:MAG: hypothetical protein HZY76_15705 [Anaerolineae bacterium]|nr:MAG: hypothetical protein HZY76_15705 [Anaerolineae bacterium]
MRSTTRRLAAALLLLVSALGWTVLPVAAQHGCTAANILYNCDFNNFVSTPFGSVPSGWTPFILSGSASFTEATDTYFGAPSLQIWSDGGTFKAGIYQQVPNVVPGATYQASVGWSAPNEPDAFIRRLGIDPTGGADPNAPTVVWGRGTLARALWQLFGRATRISTCAPWPRFDDHRLFPDRPQLQHRRQHDLRRRSGVDPGYQSAHRRPHAADGCPASGHAHPSDVSGPAARGRTQRDADGHRHTDGHPITHAAADRNAYPNTVTHRITDADGDRHRHTPAASDRHTDPTARSVQRLDRSTAQPAAAGRSG